MKICKVRPNHNQCCACLDIQISNNSVLDCEKRLMSFCKLELDFGVAIMPWYKMMEKLKKWL